ncbi:hypothetical protein C810_01676 [Lachnospiraceae bacterium A2]|nr:hypothetical protein C810_01676 [Lachnospiraceae bacterium A2]
MDLELKITERLMICVIEKSFRFLLVSVLVFSLTFVGCLKMGMIVILGLIRQMIRL